MNVKDEERYYRQSGCEEVVLNVLNDACCREGQAAWRALQLRKLYGNEPARPRTELVRVDGSFRRFESGVA